MLVDYPKEIPSESWAILADAFRGKFPSKELSAKVGWNVLGYGISLTIGDNQPPTVGAATDEELACVCDELAAGQVRGIPWGLLIPALKLLLEKLLK